MPGGGITTPAVLPESPLLPEWVFHHARATPGASAVITPTARLTYGELAERVRAFGAHLVAGGVTPGDRVVVALPNSPAAVVASLAVMTIGATAVEVNRSSSPETISEVVDRTHARTAVLAAADARTWGPVLAASRLPSVWAVASGPLAERQLASLGPARVSLLLEDGRVDPGLGTPDPPAAVELDPEAVALVLYTSGSTGRPHGVLQTFRNIDANSRSIVEFLGLRSDDRAMLVMPLSYCYGRSVLQTHLLAGGSVVLDNRFAFPRVVLDAMATEGCTGFAGVPLTFEIIRRQAGDAPVVVPGLRYLTQAGGGMLPETIAWTRRAFAPARLFVMYGQTEATARLSYLPPEQAEAKAGSIGIAVPGVELRVVDPDGRELPAGAVGELEARGANVTSGYLDEPEETAGILRDGWLRTGDLAVRDADGFLFHRGRAKEIFKIGGHRTSPVEIEQVIERHPAVLEAAVIAVPDELLGDQPVAFVVGRPGMTATSSELRRFCQERMPAWQVPARFETVDALPRNESGKLLRAELAERFARVPPDEAAPAAG